MRALMRQSAPGGDEIRNFIPGGVGILFLIEGKDPRRKDPHRKIGVGLGPIWPLTTGRDTSN
jgi:hypothetical protein